MPIIRSLMAVATGLTVCGRLMADGSVPVESNHLHVVLIGDTDDVVIGKSVTKDLELLSRLFGSLPKSLCSVSVLSGPKAEPVSTMAHLAKLSVDEADTLLVYYSGHGVIAKDRGHVLTMKAGNLSRETLSKCVLEKKARLSIVITDCCSVFYPQSMACYANFPVNTELLRYLFFRQSGFVDISSANRGEAAYCSQNGGLFTAAFERMCFGSVEQLDTDGDGVPSWDEVLVSLEKALTPSIVRYDDNVARQLSGRGASLLRERPAETVPLQHPCAFTAMPRKPPARLSRPAQPLGFVATSTQGGLRVTTVFRDSFAEWFGVAVGDQIVQIEPQGTVNTVADLEQAVDRTREFFSGRIPCVFRKQNSEDTFRAVLIWQD